MLWFLGEVSTKHGKRCGREEGREAVLMSGDFHCGSVPHFDTVSLTKPRVP